MNRLLLLLTALWIFSNAGWLVAAPPAGRVDFARQVVPILQDHCIRCHRPGHAKGKLSLATRSGLVGGGKQGPAIVVGEPGRSLLLEQIRPSAVGQRPEMPDEGEALSAEQVNLIARWIEQGAGWPDGLTITEKPKADRSWWSLQPLDTRAPPTPEDLPAGWKANPLDRFVFARLAEKGLTPNPPADRRTLIRRLTYDLTGLPPSPQQVQAFVGDRDHDAYEKVVDRLLASPHYGEHWGRHWLDVVRFGESNGFERNVIISNAWPFRDYIIRSFNQDRPFDQLVLEHLAGDVVARDNPEAAVGTTFLVCGPYDNVGNQDAVAAAQIRADTIDEMIRATSEAFLGLTVGCSRCHDHKFDPILQRDYYSLYATFAGVRHGDRAVETAKSRRLLEEVAPIEKKITEIRRELETFQAAAFPNRTILLDDEMAPGEAGDASVTVLKPQRGHGANPPGRGRGYRDDRGASHRTSNLSRSRYRWWTNQPGIDLFSWNPAAKGHFRIWLSWGCGWHTHTPDAQYILDHDGNLETRKDQVLIATIDQRQFAGGGPSPLPSKALWSGFADAGVHEFGPRSRIVLRGGKRGQAATADLVVLQEQAPGSEPTRQPRLRRPVDPARNIERIDPVSARFLRLTVLATNSAEPCIDELEVYAVGDGDSPPVNVAAAGTGAKVTSSGDYQGNPKHRLAHINDGRYGNARSWISSRAGSGWVQIEFAGRRQIDRIVWGRDRQGQYGDRLATAYRIEVASEPGQWKQVASSADRVPWSKEQGRVAADLPVGLAPSEAKRAQALLDQLRPLELEAKRLRDAARPAKWWVGNFQQVNGPFHVFVGGSPQNRGEQVVPASLQTLGKVSAAYELEANAPESQRRLALARWIVAPDNPLTPRVLANRLWHYHFGTGIVETPSDFGYMGGRPTHPRLLDWLAGQVRAHGWKLKPVHKLIVMSQSYRQSAAYRDKAAKIDNDARYLWRFPPRRLSGEEIRDTILSLAGKLNTKDAGGPGFRLYQYVQDNVATYIPLDKHGPDTWRRAVYHHHARAARTDVLTDFDCPDPAMAAPRRASTTTPLQALTLMNHSFAVDMAGFMAERLVRDSGTPEPRSQIRRAYQLAFARDPSATEQRRAVAFAESWGMRALCRALINSNELIHVR